MRVCAGFEVNHPKELNKSNQSNTNALVVLIVYVLVVIYVGDECM
jgi:hypothetical protein